MTWVQGQAVASIKQILLPGALPVLHASGHLANKSQGSADQHEKSSVPGIYGKDRLISCISMSIL